MIKKTMIVIGIAAFAVIWWMGLEKVTEISKTEPSYGTELDALVGK